MKKYIILIAVAICTFVGCTDPVEDYYVDQNSTNARTETLLSYLSADEDYTLFVELINESGLIDTMTDGYQYTLFVPNNSALEAAGIADMTADSMLLYMQMHICANPKSTSTLAYTSRLLMYSGKYLAITQDDDGSYLVDGVSLVEADILCTNGVVHKVGDVLTPRLTIYEWLQAAGDEYSMFREALDEETVYIFDRENSVQIGETAMGRPIYDSVFYVYNPILAYGDISDEEGLYRFVIPTNDVITETFTAMADSYIVKGMPVTSADSTLWMDWYLETSTFDYSESGIEYFEDLDTIAEFSVFDNEFRPTAVTMSEPLRLSNGFAYTITKGHLPAYIPMETVSVYPQNIRRAFWLLGIDAGYNTAYSARYYLDGSGYDGWTSLQSTWWNAGVWCSTTMVQMFFAGGYNADGTIEYFFKSVDLTYGDTEFTEVEVVPGNYTLDISNLGVVSNTGATGGNDGLEISVNDYLVDELWDVPNGAYDALTQIGDPNGFYIGDSIGMVKFSVKIFEDRIHEDYTAYECAIRVGNFVLTPYNNY